MQLLESCTTFVFKNKLINGSRVVNKCKGLDFMAMVYEF